MATPVRRRLRDALRRKLEINEAQADALIDGGLPTVKMARQASEERLLELGLAKGKAREIRGGSRLFI